MNKAYIAFGANIGDSRSNIARALKRLSDYMRVEKVSSLYKTSAVGGPQGQPDFLNGVALVEPQGNPAQTMEILLEIEREMGRERVERWGPRIIDLDLLDQDGMVIDEPSLKLPHPRIAERAFVLVPLAEIAPEWRHPVGGLTASEMLENLGDEDRAVVIDSVGAGLALPDEGAASSAPTSKERSK